MRYRLLGRTGLRVSELFLGAMTFGDGGVSPVESRRIFDLYGEAGGNVVDTAGKILYVGISDAPAWVVAHANTLADWRGWTPFAGLQVPYNLLNRDIERELLPMAESFGMTVAAWGPLARGILSGKFTRPGGPETSTRVAADSLGARELTAARAVQEIADEAYGRLDGR